MPHRPLTQAEIMVLKQQGCFSEHWGRLLVKEPFDTRRVSTTTFSGDVRLGVFEAHHDRPGGISLPSGIYHSHVHNCVIGDNARVSRVAHLANYHIEERAFLDRIVSALTEGTSSFGNGVQLHVINETGDRPLIIFDRLSAQLAYFLALYRDKPRFIETLEGLIRQYVQTKTKPYGQIGSHAVIENSGTIRNINLGEYGHVSSASHLENGTIVSCREAPAHVGGGVFARDFIMQSGSKVDSQSILSSAFIGQGTVIEKQFSVDHTAMFANCMGMHGEACSALAGPYTVTHHKSTLLIAALFSFFNAGSGTNQSNHMYKLGPMHQGIMERGAKTGSNAYLLWPSRVGAFTAVIGKHFTPFDSSEFPFSYITEREGKSVITPAGNLFTVGAMRDAEKWPQRDRRTDPNPIDLIHFQAFSPYTIGNMLRGIESLNALSNQISKDAEYIHHKGIALKRLHIKNSVKQYEAAAQIFIGDGLAKRLESCETGASWSAVKTEWSEAAPLQRPRWLDIAGLLAPREKIAAFVEAVETQALSDIDSIYARLRGIYEAYDESEWEWQLALMRERLDTQPADWTLDQMKTLIENWRVNKQKMHAMIVQDASKEFSEKSQIGFGIDGGETEQAADFETVRGTIDSNPIIQRIRAEMERIESAAQSALEKLGSFSDR